MTSIAQVYQRKTCRYTQTARGEYIAGYQVTICTGFQLSLPSRLRYIYGSQTRGKTREARSERVVSLSGEEEEREFLSTPVRWACHGNLVCSVGFAFCRILEFSRKCNGVRGSVGAVCCVWAGDEGWDFYDFRTCFIDYF